MVDDWLHAVRVDLAPVVLLRDDGLLVVLRLAGTDVLGVRKGILEKGFCVGNGPVLNTEG